VSDTPEADEITAAVRQSYQAQREAEIRTVLDAEFEVLVADPVITASARSGGAWRWPPPQGRDRRLR
jgi:hypothetical protein